MGLGRIVRGLIVFGFVAALVGGTIVTVTAASEGGLLQGSGQADSPTAQEDPEGQFAWQGVVVKSDLEGEHLEIQGPCGQWVLLAANDAVGATLKGLVGKKTVVVGAVFEGATTYQRHAITVEAVLEPGAALPEGVQWSPSCHDNKHPLPKPERHMMGPAPFDLMGLLQRFGLQSLEGVPAEQRFEHILGAQFRLLDKDGKEIVTEVVPGVVVSVNGQTLTIDPNGPTAETSYTVPEDARLLRPQGGKLADLKQGDKVLVVLQNTTPVVIIASMQATIWPPMGPKPPIARGHGEMKPRQEMPRGQGMPRGHSQYRSDYPKPGPAQGGVEVEKEEADVEAVEV